MKTRYGIFCALAGVMAIAVAAMVAHAAVQQNISVPFTLQDFVPCAAGGAGELIDVSGYLHETVSLTVNNNHASGTYMFQPQGVSGYGETTGEKYNATGRTGGTFTMSLQNGEATQTFVNNFRLIGQGPGNNLLVHENAHLIINANGTVTSFVDNYNITCK